MTKIKTDIVHEVDHNAETPSTHALVIAIGCYPSARNGCTDSELADLISPPHSAKAIADWLISDFDNPSRPLATVSMIVSDTTPYEYLNPKTGNRYEVPIGTSADVKQCVRRWVKRATANSKNGCVFYFCGHGVRSGERDAVLTRSYGEDTYDSLAGVFDRASLQGALQLLGPEHQILIFDACRKIDPSVFGGNDNLTNFLKPALADRPFNAVTQSRLFAAAEGLEAFGRTGGGPSLFASEFIKASRYPSESDDGWWAETSAVAKHVARVLGDQQCQHEGMASKLTRIGDNPVIPVVVYSKPSEHIGRMRIACSCKDREHEFDGSSELDAVEWRLELLNGTYNFTATACRVDDFQTINNSEVMIYPPFRKIVVDVEQGTLK